ncbi:MAG: APC family permease [Candidatus Dormiibacterota bacterium]
MSSQPLGAARTGDARSGIPRAPGGVPRRRVKVRGGSLGWFLCWAVVIADIGTSVYYTPGILFGSYGTRSGIFVTMTLVVFVLLAIKYAEVTWRFPEGGGVVNVSATALHPFAGMLGGMFILVDYYLTAAISAVSGVIYLSVVFPALHPIVTVVTLGALAALGLLNFLGIKESARVNAVFVVAAVLGQFAVVIATAWFLGGHGIGASFQALGRGHQLTTVFVVQGYAGAFLAFSGLESIAQLAPSMREPRPRVAARAMGFIVLTIAATSPLLTIWSTVVMGRHGVDPNQFISLLGAHVGGGVLGGYVAVTAALLLIFASNTAVIGAYHVFVALARMGFLPRGVERRNRWRDTPHVAILLAVGVPVVIVAVSRGDVNLLGDLYAFGLLAAFVLTCLSLDIIRWYDYARRRWTVGRAVMFGLGVATTLLVALAWGTNLVNKPLATVFGGGLTVLGMIVGLATYAYRRPLVFPILHRAGVPVTPLAMARRMPHAELMVVLPHDLPAAEAVVSTALQRAREDVPIVFLYRGNAPSQRHAEMLEVADPYLQDRGAQAAFRQAERAARKVTRNRRYVYIPGSFRREAVGDIWKRVRPRETVVCDGDQDVLPPIALDRVRRSTLDNIPILRLVSGRT